ncbi:MAG: aminotransferase class IV [Gemmataceae bacterium]
MDPAVAYLNGQFIYAAAASLPVHDAGFVMGATVTDTMRTFRQQLFRVDDHLRRFRQSCELCRIPQPISDERLRAIADELVERNAKDLPADGELAVVLFATPGPFGHFVGEAEDGPPTLGMHTFPLPVERHRRLFTHGARLAIPAMRGTPMVDPRAKQRSRMHWWIARQQARDTDPLAEPLLCDEAGHVTETATANLLVVKNGQVWSPPAGTVLGGVSSQVVRELCQALGIAFGERLMSPDDCFTADELLLTCITWCLAGVSALNGRAIPWPGPVLKRLQDAWSQEVGVDLLR